MSHKNLIVFNTPVFNLKHFFIYTEKVKKYIRQHHMTPIVQSNENMYFFSCTQVSQYRTFQQNIPIKTFSSFHTVLLNIPS